MYVYIEIVNLVGHVWQHVLVHCRIGRPCGTLPILDILFLIIMASLHGLGRALYLHHNQREILKNGSG